MLDISPQQRRALRARAHHLDPVVIVGQHGMTLQVLHEIDSALAAHELVKVRVHNDDRAERERLLVEICDRLACAPVQHLGKLLIVWRPADEATSERDARPSPTKRRRKSPSKRPQPLTSRARSGDTGGTKRQRDEATGERTRSKTVSTHRRGASRMQFGSSPAPGAARRPRSSERADERREPSPRAGPRTHARQGGAEHSAPRRPGTAFARRGANNNDDRGGSHSNAQNLSRRRRRRGGG